MQELELNVDMFLNANIFSQNLLLVFLFRKMSTFNSCSFEQQLNVLQHVNRIFHSHKVSSILIDIIIYGLCQSKIYEKIPPALYQELHSVLPSDKQLNLNDSLYKSRLVQERIDGNQNDSLGKRKRRLPLTILRIPTDLQCHLFHYLHFKDLMNVQKVCRALCIAARNPLAIFRLDINPSSSRIGPFSKKEWFSRPKMLCIDEFLPVGEPYRIIRLKSEQSIIGNDLWSNNVVELRMRSSRDDIIDKEYSVQTVPNLVSFRKLVKCQILRSPILTTGLIASYDTLKELTLEGIMITEDTIDQIQKFQNLEKLTLMDLDPNPDRLQHSQPILLRKLKLFSYEMGKFEFREFQRFLIGSNPETVFTIGTSEFYRYDTASESLKCYPLDFSRDCNMEFVVNQILNAPIGTFTVVDLYIGFELLRDEEQYMEEELDSWDGQESEDRETMRSAIRKRAADAAKWMEPWLVFDEQRMEQIGLQKLNIELHCDLEPDFEYLNTMDLRRNRFDRAFDRVIDECLQEKIGYWKAMGRKCIFVKSHENERSRGYTVTLSLCV